jgi:O-antigen chain-terminating methyltransferase
LSQQVGQQQAEVLARQAQALEAWKAQVETLSQQVGQQQAEVLARQAQALEAWKAQVETLSHPQDQALRAIRERVSRAEQKLRRLLHILTNGQQEGEPVTIERKTLPRQALESEFDYFGFEERFRGSEEEIKERQRRYVEHFRGTEQVLDVGSGRGEFLELLREAGITARGVDTNLDMVLLCKEKRLDVLHEDVFGYLEALPDESLGGIFAAQLIEHFPPSAIISLIRLCHRKLKPNGVLLLETPNPQCLTTLAWAFYMDFSHLWPCHPESMRYLLETMGFRDVRLEFSAPVAAQAGIPFVRDPSLFGEETERFNRAAQLLNDLIFGFQDYAIIGRRI